MGKLKICFLDDFTNTVTPEALLEALKSDKRYVKVVYHIEEVLSEVDLLRVLFEAHTFKCLGNQLMFEQYPGYSEYILIIFNSSIPRKLYYMKDRVDAGEIYRKVIRSFDINVPHFVIHSGPVVSPEEINPYQFVHNLSAGKYYRNRCVDLNSFISNFESPKVLGSAEKGYAELKELSFKNLSHI